MNDPPDPLSSPSQPPRVVAVTLIVIVGLLLLRYELPAVCMVFSGVLLGLALKTVSRWIADRTRLPYRAVVGVLVALLVAAAALGLWRLGASLAQQAKGLVEQLPRAMDELMRRVQRDDRLRSIVGPASAQQAMHVAPTRVVSEAARAASAFVEAGGVLAVVFFLGVYGALDPDGCVRPIVRLAPMAHRERITQVLSLIGENLARWMLGRLVAMAFVGVLATLGLTLLKVPMALLLGVLAGLAAFVEYVGAVASALPPAVLALARSPAAALGVLGLFTVAHVIEGYVLTPYLARSMVRIPPVHTLAVQVIAGSLFGVVGLTFATPLLVVGVIAVRSFYVEDLLGDHTGG